MSIRTIDTMTTNIMTLNRVNDSMTQSINGSIDGVLKQQGMPKAISQVIGSYHNKGATGCFSDAAGVAERILDIYTDIIGEGRQATHMERQELRNLRQAYWAAGSGLGIRPGDVDHMDRSFFTGLEDVDGIGAFLEVNERIADVMNDVGLGNHLGGYPDVISYFWAGG